MRMIQLVILSALLAVTSVSPLTAESAHVHVHALLVLASKQAGESDPRLGPYEPTLRRILRFESFRLAGEGSSDLQAPGKASVTLSRGHALEFEADKTDGKGMHLRVVWQDAGRSLMNTGLVLRPGVPAVLGGPSTGKEGEVFAVILIAE